MEEFKEGVFSNKVVLELGRKFNEKYKNKFSCFIGAGKPKGDLSSYDTFYAVVLNNELSKDSSIMDYMKDRTKEGCVVFIESTNFVVFEKLLNAIDDL